MLSNIYKSCDIYIVENSVRKLFGTNQMHGFDVNLHLVNFTLPTRQTACEVVLTQVQEWPLVVRCKAQIPDSLVHQSFSLGQSEHLFELRPPQYNPFTICFSARTLVLYMIIVEILPLYQHQSTLLDNRERQMSIYYFLYVVLRHLENISAIPWRGFVIEQGNAG